MDWSSNLIQILLFIQFMPLKDTFSNPSLKARIWMPSQQQCDVNGSKLRCSCSQSSRHSSVTSLDWPGDRLGPRYGTSVPRHTCPHCHLSWEQPFKSLHFYILPSAQYSDQILTTVAYIILNWMKIEKQPSTRLVPPPALALLMTFHNTHLRPDDQLTFQPTNK